jgi:hypothetical protein
MLKQKAKAKQRFNLKPFRFKHSSSTTWLLRPACNIGGTKIETAFA